MRAAPCSGVRVSHPVHEVACFRAEIPTSSSFPCQFISGSTGGGAGRGAESAGPVLQRRNPRYTMHTMQYSLCIPCVSVHSVFTMHALSYAAVPHQVMMARVMLALNRRPGANTPSPAFCLCPHRPSGRWVNWGSSLEQARAQAAKAQEESARLRRHRHSDSGQRQRGQPATGEYLLLYSTV